MEYLRDAALQRDWEQHRFLVDSIELPGRPVTDAIAEIDDDLHQRTNNPWWTETVWFAWMVPERNLVGYFYPIFRPNLGVQAGGVLVFDDRAELPWELPIFEYDWHQQIPQGIDLRDARLNNGMTIKCVEMGKTYDLGYKSRDLNLSLRVDAVARPLVTAATVPFIHGHIDQLCHVTGSMDIRGDVIAVDCPGHAGPVMGTSR